MKAKIPWKTFVDLSSRVLGASAPGLIGFGAHVQDESPPVERLPCVLVRDGRVASVGAASVGLLGRQV